MLKLTDDQIKAKEVCGGYAKHIMLYGGARSGKSVLHARNIFARALMAPGSRHTIFRFRFAHCRQSIGLETIPFVLQKEFKGMECNLDKKDWFYRLPNDSEVWLGGLDDKERTEKILGKEYVTAWLNECSQIQWKPAELVDTRLAQKVKRIIGGKDMGDLPPRIYYDQNPPPKSHWTYQLFEKKLHPEDRKPLTKPANYASFRMNPEGNAENLNADFIDDLKNASLRIRTRFFAGEYADDNPFALFSEANIDRWREESKPLELMRVVIGVDPSGAGDDDAIERDDIGIIVVGLGLDGNAYVLDDCTVNASPGVWGNVVASAYDRHDGDKVVGEVNFGGDMVRYVVHTANSNIPFSPVHASRGKWVRAEPIAALYEKGKVRHVGEFRELEDELLAFSQHGYTGMGSPNRADALIWAIYELFPSLTKGTKKHEELKVMSFAGGRGFWGG